jgi:N-acetylglutamate synthase-like GNAT family acetyltransferase
MMARPMIGATSKLSIRRAVAGDIPQIAEMMRQVSGREHSLEAVQAITSNFQPGEFYGWIACAGDEPVGVTMLQPLALDRLGTRIQGGYWRYLWIRPDHRGTTLYPRLVLTMIAEAASLNIDLVYGAIRRPEVAAGHLALGMEKVAELPVLMKPLRPARLLCKFYAAPRAFAGISAVPDALYRQYLNVRNLKRPAEYAVEDETAAGIDLRTVVPVLEEPYNDDVRRLLTAETFAARYRANADGDPYRVLSVRTSDGVQAAIVYRIASRRKIRNLVIMEMGCRSSDGGALKAGLFELERRAIRSDCEVILALFSRRRMRDVLRKAGYFKSNETYILMKKWTKKADRSGVKNVEMDKWHFTFADHDAF